MKEKPYFCIMAQHNDIGAWGEEHACEYLQRQGYIIVDRDWHYGRSKRDIDIVCKTPDLATVVFVEVKTREHEEITAPEDAVDLQKMAFLGRAADNYVHLYDVAEALRFDIITVIGRKDSTDIKINHIEDAFNPLLI